MIAAGVQGVDFIVANTDAQALTMSKAERLIQIGTRMTEGLGAGSQPEVGRVAAEETIDAIRESLSFDESLEGIVRVSVVATGIDNLDSAVLAQPVESSLTELASRLRDDSPQIADRVPPTDIHHIGASVQFAQ
jgi:cell division GTPase FtsZ